MDVHLLGPVEALINRGPVALGATKQRALLAMLALEAEHTVSVDRLVEGLWGDDVPPSAHKMVQHYVSQLRRLLDGDAGEIVTRGRGYELHLGGGASDVARFERLLDEGAQRAREALSLCRGPPLADVADQPFAGPEIRRLDELRLRAFELATDRDLAVGRHREVLAEIDALVAEHPLSERLHAQRMLALYRCGRQAEALEAFREARQVLVDEVGIEPGPELRALHEAMLRQDPALDADCRPSGFPPLGTGPLRPTNLPTQHRRLIGREGELRTLSDMLAHGEERLVTLLGLGGTGKTHLAVVAGHTLLSAFDGGVWLVPLAGVHEPAAIVPAIAAAIGVRDAPGRSLIDALVQRLRERLTLLVLDNFEQLVDGAASVTQLLDGAPDTRALVTSQLPLRIADERVMRLEPLQPDAAAHLFGERAEAVLTGFDREAHREAIEEICVRVDGMPLAVELAAARVAVMSPRDVLDHLDRSSSVLARGPRDLPARHRSLRATLEWAHGLLEPDARTLLARLAACAGPIPSTPSKYSRRSSASTGQSTRSMRSAPWSTRRWFAAGTALHTASATTCRRPSATSPPTASRRQATSTPSARRTLPILHRAPRPAARGIPATPTPRANA